MTTENVPRLAATVLVLRDGAQGPEVFMVRRHEGTGAFRGAHVFPGGRVDDHDADGVDDGWCDGVEHARLQLPALPAVEAIAFHVAAARELFEEAGVLLARQAGTFVPLAGEAHERFKAYRVDVHAHQRSLGDIVRREGLRLALDSLTLYAHWVTPVVEGRRFDTRFFVTRLPPFQSPAHDETETTESVWMTARGALDAAAHRALTLPPPTWTTLRELESFRSVEDIMESSKTREMNRREPQLVHENGTRMLVLPGSRTRFVWTDDYWRPEELE